MSAHLEVDVAKNAYLKMKNNNKVFKPIAETISGLDLKSIDESRVNILTKLIDLIQEKINQKKQVQLIFICTHNSRRSHLAQIWAQTFSYYFKLKNIHSFSAGTEETALYPMVATILENQGFKVDKTKNKKNPHYQISYTKKALPINVFSKKIDHPINPIANFTAIMTCSEADDDCPIIIGADNRIALTYEDPKAYDHLPIQLEKYNLRSLQIATEMYYVFSKIKS